MSRLYQYAESNDKSGLFLLDGYKGKNTTFQVTETAERLLNHIDYDPGILNSDRGPRIPDELHWGLFEIGWIYTNESGITQPTNEQGEPFIEGENIEVTDEIAEDIMSFLQETEDNDIGELVDILNIDISGKTDSRSTSTHSQSPIWEISDSRRQEIADGTESRLKKALLSENEAEWHTVFVEGTRADFDGIEKSMITIHIKDLNKSNVEYLHVAYFCPEHGFEKVATATNREANWKCRLWLERNRQRFIESLIAETDNDDIYIGDPDADLNLSTDYNSSVLH